MRGRSYSYSPLSPRGYNRRLRSPSPRIHYGGRSRDLPISLLVRNLHRDCSCSFRGDGGHSDCQPMPQWRYQDMNKRGPEDLCRPFGRFGPLKDIYLPRDYYTGEPRGFGFVQYVDPADAADAKYYMDGKILFGCKLTVVFAQESRKKPSEMRARDRIRGRSYDYRRSPVRYSSRSPEYSPSPQRSHYSRSISPRDRRYRERSYSRSPYRSYSRSPRSPYRSYSRSPYRSRSRSQTRSRSRSLDYYS